MTDFEKFPSQMQLAENPMVVFWWQETTRKQLQEKRTLLNDECKVILDEIERGVYSSQKHLFEVMFNLADKIPKEVLEALG